MVAKPYKCIVCGNTDPDTFARCYHPGCPDGHDQPGRFPSYPPTPLTAEDRRAGRVILLILAFLLISMVYACNLVLSTAHAADHGYDHSAPVVQWFDGLLQPDRPVAATDPLLYGCCTKSDAYEADIYDVEGYNTGRKMCNATITEGSEKKFADSSTRTAIPNGTKIEFACSKVNPPKDGNPTGHAWIFAAASGVHTTFCFVPLLPGS
jgi:hypothetical protein